LPGEPDHVASEATEEAMADALDDDQQTIKAAANELQASENDKTVISKILERLEHLENSEKERAAAKKDGQSGRLVKVARSG
jgi:hypothetical protein